MILSSFLATVLGSFIFYQSLHDRSTKNTHIQKRVYLLHAGAVVFFLSILILSTTQSTLLAVTIPLLVIYLPMWVARIPTASFLDRAELLIIALFICLTSSAAAQLSSVSVIGFAEACLLLAQVMVNVSSERRNNRK